jgi:uncharacterized membrane protein YhhN
MKLILSLALILLAALLYCEKFENRKGMLPTKTLLSLLFIITGLSQVHLWNPYTMFIILGLVFCLGGDVFLALPQERMFLFGLISFLIGHVCYVIGFFWIANLGSMTFVGVVTTVVVGIPIFRWLKPHLGSMQKPVMAYIAVISLMVIAAWSLLGTSSQPDAGRWFVFLGAISFYVSDIFVARDRFLKNSFINRLWGLPLYYLGQFLIAFSIGSIR